MPSQSIDHTSRVNLAIDFCHWMFCASSSTCADGVRLERETRGWGSRVRLERETRGWGSRQNTGVLRPQGYYSSDPSTLRRSASEMNLGWSISHTYRYRYIQVPALPQAHHPSARGELTPFLSVSLSLRLSLRLRLCLCLSLRLRLRLSLVLSLSLSLPWP